MKYLVLLRHVDDPAHALSKAQGDAIIEEHLRHDHALQRAQKYVIAGALAPERAGRTVRVRDGKVSVTDGPFAETKEQLGGFYVLEAKDLDEAVQLAAGIPSVRHGWAEVRPFRDLYDDLYPPPPPRAAPVWPPTPRFVDQPALSLAGFTARYTPETIARIPAQWGRFGSQVGQVIGPKGPACYGLCYRWRDGGMEYACAIAAAPEARLPEGWSHLTLPARRYAVFTHDDHVSTMPRVASWILDTWLPGSGQRRAADFAGGVELVEWYGERFDPERGYDDIEFWLPLEG